MPDIQQFEQGLQATLLSVLRKMPNVTSVYEEASEEPDNGIDFVVNASVNGKPVRLLRPGEEYSLSERRPCGVLEHEVRLSAASKGR